jgi:hypothetical protein
MAPPPPSQAGKFKPRKPAAKKIVVGGAVGAADATAAATTSASTGGSGGRGRGHGRGAGGRGRGSGGQGRAPMPRGQVFFTGTPAASTTKASRGGGAGGGPTAGRGGIKTAASAAGNKAKTIKMERKDKDDDNDFEVIVGELEVGVGAHHLNSGKKESILERDDDDDERTPYGGSDRYQVETHFSVAETYDSDSSVEEQQHHRNHRDNRYSALRPTQLPFPIPPMPIGIGGPNTTTNTKRPALYECQEEKKDESSETMNRHNHTSPFCDTANVQACRKEQESWFLFQFPTRLPLSSIVPESAVISSDPLVAANTTPVVSTPSFLENAFDNSMKHGGKLGTIKVYKSGKTVLDMGNGLIMDVSEGLPNGFFQQATVIDPAEGNYVVMGQVQKTVVVTPDVKGAFGV